MDFITPYTEQQEQFRKEVQSWLQENVPEKMKEPIDLRDFTEEHYQFWRGKHQELAAKGWLYPNYPKEYGGGGLTGDHETILAEEFYNFRVPRSFTNVYVLPALLVWGTEEQKQQFLVPLLTAKCTAWQKFTEAQSGADLANVKSKAVRDGDDWVLSGQSVYISGRGPEPDWLFGPMLTDADAPRHRNLGFFMIPSPSQGLEIKTQALLTSNEQHTIFLDNVRVPGDHLIGGASQGWQVTNTSLEEEHGGRGRAFPADPVVGNLVEYVRKTKMNGGTLGDDPLLQQQTMDAYIDAHVDGLMAKRTFWMYQNRMEITYEGNVHNVHNRLKTMRQAIRVRHVMKMDALLDGNEPGAPHGGAQEVEQRYAAGQRHAAGSTNIAKVILARRIGISRTKERPAPTPSTATTHTG
ncbi:MAG: acyl-CoA dehydrogenase family protein [Dehalococcoidia bacterium]|jgi:alkylation response protein AidB-like acyl-CoA dehydrogenase|nr:acyl-CoA dehydrogenase family protein [Dehalococcoidia bacterium]MDP7082929.1 acyl-CoA dehydrogenase family protein [Dehalococcoidia bacterium]MDP7201157.1 acyl-CoA dehydrogenase family protein [Dehalococcoidia bacterium]MDP7510378.1 acyl-CoA dehydrogenase family protein [Dehalococcoidia bacterium]HJN85826.1 acyl-CoA dehydrogenase family protein [Dehalococcoidia bacterium]|tara:strand:+ start:153 stop:1379 length:1227 start_codon:yes stop_codon:yes gene_type:complete